MTRITTVLKPYIYSLRSLRLPKHIQAESFKIKGKCLEVREEDVVYLFFHFNETLFVLYYEDMIVEDSYSKMKRSSNT